MGAHEDTVRILETELGQVEGAFRGLSAEQWATPTKLLPVDEAQPPWTLFELAGHFDISIGLTVMLMAEPQAGQVGRDRVSFFIFPRSEVAPVVYDYAYTMVEGKTPEQMPDVLAATFPAGTLSGAPKVRAMEIIEELEPTRRGPYGGAVGYISYSGNMDSCITIRTVVCHGQRACIQVGAGIVADSDPKTEWLETCSKARGMILALRTAAQETGR